MTRTEIRRRILQALNDSTTAPVAFALHEVDAWIDDAMALLAEESEALKRTFIVPRRAGTMIYHLEGIGDNLMVPYRLWLPDLQRRLEVWAIRDLDRRHETWMDVTGDPISWWPIDWQHFGIWPIPAAAGGVIEVNCYVWPLPLIDDRSRPEYAPVDQEALIQFGIAEGLLHQRMPEQAAQAEAQWVQKWGRVGTRASVGQMLAALHVREKAP